MINCRDFKELIVIPSLSVLSQYDRRILSESAISLMLGTAAQESHMGYWLDQIGGGPGLGPFSVEVNTNLSIWMNYLYYRDDLSALVLSVVPDSSIRKISGRVYVHESQLVTNLIYSCIMSRLVYWPKSEPLPEADDIPGQGRYWDVHYNVNDEHGTPQEFVDNYNRFVRSQNA